MKSKKKLKGVLVLSTPLLILYSLALIFAPSIILVLLPIIICMVILTVGVPSYAIIKNIKDTMETKNKAMENNKLNTKKENAKIIQKELEENNIENLPINENKFDEVIDLDRQKIIRLNRN